MNWWWVLPPIVVSVVAGLSVWLRPDWFAGFTLSILKRAVEYIWSLFRGQIKLLDFGWTPPKDEAERKERARAKAHKEMSRK